MAYSPWSAWVTSLRTNILSRVHSKRGSFTCSFKVYWLWKSVPGTIWTNAYTNKCSNGHDHIVSLTVVLSRRTRLDAPESGLKVTILEVEYTGRRNAFPAHTIWTSSLSPDRVKLKVSYVFREYFLCKRYIGEKWHLTYSTQPHLRAEQSRTDIRITDLFISTTTLLLSVSFENTTTPKSDS